MSARRSPRRRGGVLRWLGWLLLLPVAWVVGVASYIVLVGGRDQAAPADTIIVLGAAAYDARPSPVFEQRILHGIDLYQRGLAKRIIFTGGYGGGGARFSESQVARRYALRQGVPAKAILIESVSRNTQENLQQANRVMHRQGLRSAIIVSDPLHMSRALRISRDVGINAVGSPTPTTRFRSLTTRWRFLANEVYFFHRDAIARLRRV
ncbi:MAG: YdcF family protein [Pseudoxanthomonas sp.]|nr:YdcF family protein [Pseudoxanthomonas sp.]